MNSENRTLIITGGFVEVNFSKEILEQYEFRTVIAVDSGLKYARMLELYPDYLVGDFDSIDPELLISCQKEGKSVICKYPPEKDATDTQLAVELAIERKSSEIIILGATGCRIDHMLANIHLLLKCLEQDIPAFLYEPNNRISLINKERSLKKSQVFGSFISLLPLSGTCTGVTLTGMKYPLTEAVLVPGDSIGISNEIILDEAKIKVKNGTLILFETMD